MATLRKLTRLIRLRFGLPYVRRADRARDGGEWVEAMLDYRRGLEWLPWREDLKVQIGNCLKEFGDYRGAMRAYASVTGGMSLPEARKQAADTDRRAGGVLLPYAIGEMPDATYAARSRAPVPMLSDRLLPHRIRLDAIEPRGWLGPLGQDAHLSHRLRGAGYATIKLDQVGTMSLEREGAQEPLLAGVVAVRGRISSLIALTEAELRVGGNESSARGAGETAPFITTVPLHPAHGRGPLKIYVFNAWIDTDALSEGRHWLSIEVGRRLAPAGLFVNVARAEPGAFATSDAFVAAPSGVPAIGAVLDEAVAALPARVRPAARTLFDRPVGAILVLRVDQLGDVSASLAALSRLRAIFPAARLSVLAQPGVIPVIAASGVADEVVPITLAYDPETGRRRLDPAEEGRVRADLAGRCFDLAIDLSPGDESRPLLLLAGATWLVGFNPDRFTFLDFGIAARSRDKVNGLDKLPHAAAVAMLVEALAVAATPVRAAVPRVAAHDNADRAVLAALGLRPRGYIVLHLGARHPINRWPPERFADLAERLLAETAHDVVLFAGKEVPPMAASGRMHRFDLLDPDRFDILVSGARALVGNDSGPKHLAAARGVPTVSVHVDRLNWDEWGQDGIGAIVSKQVPCTGCGLNDIALCGRDAVCVRAITTDEVFAALGCYL